MSTSWSLPASGSIWNASLLRPHARLGGELPPRTSVVVVGAGVCGLVTAAMLVDQGVDVVVVDEGNGPESTSAGKVSVLHDLSAAKIARQRGRAIARQYIAANVFGADWIARYVEEHDVACAWEVRDAVTYVNEPSSFGQLQADVELYRAGGVDVGVDVEHAVPFAMGRSVTARHQAQFDPAAFLHRVAVDVAASGSVVMYGTRVTGVDRRGGRVSVQTSAGEISAGHVIVTTASAFLDCGLLVARAAPQSSCVVACEVEAPIPAAMYLEADGGKRSIRMATTREGSDVLLVEGASHTTGEGSEIEQRSRSLVAWTNDHFGVRSVTHSFMAQDDMTGDHMPFAGPSTPGDDRILVAAGMSRWSCCIAPAVAAANISGIVGAETPSWSRAFTSSRSPVTGLSTLVKANANLTRNQGGGRARRGAISLEVSIQAKTNDGAPHSECRAPTITSRREELSCRSACP